jgi:hypothetical protein
MPFCDPRKSNSILLVKFCMKETTFFAVITKRSDHVNNDAVDASPTNCIKIHVYCSHVTSILSKRCEKKVQKFLTNANLLET